MEQHQRAELVLYSSEAQASVNSYCANSEEGRDEEGVWTFGPELSDQALEMIEQNILSKVSFLILAIRSAWPWLVGLGMRLAILQGLWGCAEQQPAGSL